MEFSAFLRLLWKRRVIVAASLIVGMILSIFALANVVKPEYSASASLVLLSPSDGLTEEISGDIRGSNPYLLPGSSLATMAEVMVEAFKDPTLQRELADSGASQDYGLVSQDSVVTISASGNNSDRTQKTLDVLLEAFTEDLAQRQINAGSPRNLLISDSIVRRSLEPSIDHGSQIRALVAIGALTVIAAISLSLLAESVSDSRALRRSLASKKEGPSILERDADARVEKRSKKVAAAEASERGSAQVRWRN